MVGFIFTLCLLCILAMVGFLFAWMVRLASFPETSETELDKMRSLEEPIIEVAKAKR